MGRQPLTIIEKHIGNNIRQKRLEKGISQEKFAAIFDISFQQLQKYERGKSKISAVMLYEISEILETNIDFFFQRNLPKDEATIEELKKKIKKLLQEATFKNK
jgi:transcriptional regulator with XRE-family HTH domain